MKKRLQGTFAVTGLTGFIGAHLAEKMLGLHADVRAITRRSHRFDTPVQQRLTPLDDPDGLTEALAGADAVVHLAGTVRGRGLEDFRAANVDAVTNLCMAIDRQSPRPPLLLISSLAASRPELSDYAASKYAGEQALAAWPHLDYTILRPPAVYGPGEREMRPLFDWMRRGLTLVPGNPRQRLTFLHVDDLAGAIVTWLRDPGRCRHGLFHIDDGTPFGYDWPAIVRAVGAPRNRTVVLPVGIMNAIARLNLALSGVLRYAPMLTPGKVGELTRESWQGDDGSFGTLTGWRPRFDLERGLEQTFGGT